MKHLGDITKIDGHTVPRCEVVIGGSPCQDLSVAGKRAGLAGERSGLFMEQIRIIKEMRERDERDGRTDHDVFPRWMVWENVPGALSSNDGEDFRAVLEETAGVADEGAAIPRYEGGSWRSSGVIMGDGWSIAWRIHDAQYWGVPQRRRRICLVADFAGDSAPWIVFDSLRGDAVGGCPLPDVGHSGGGGGSEVRFIADGLRRNPAPCGSERKRAAGESAGGAGETGKKFGVDLYNGRINGEIAATLGENSGKPDSAGPKVMFFSQNGRCEVSEHQVANAITTNQKACSRGAAMIYGFQPQAGARTGLAVMKDVAPCMQVGQKCGIFAETYQSVTGCLNPGAHPGSYNGQDAYNDMLVTGQFVRRLTPLECERLQGYPDGWTDIGDWIDSKGKKRKTSDAARYKALGNSIALPYWRVMLGRLIRFCSAGTMASLFDGIGGFPLCWGSVGGETLWASEIEEFPLAVTRRRFGED